MDSIPRSKKPGHYSSGDYQIASIELENGRREIANLYRPGPTSAYRARHFAFQRAVETAREI